MASDDAGQAYDMRNIEAIQSEIAHIAPEFEAATVAVLGEGMHNFAVLVGKEFVFRFAKHTEAALGLRREIAILPHLAPRLPIKVPQFEYIGDHSATGLPFVGYRVLRGEPLAQPLYDNLSRATQEQVVDAFAGFLSAIHGFPVEEAVNYGLAQEEDRAGYLEDLQRAHKDIFPLLDGKVRYNIEFHLESFLDDDANFGYGPTLLHADLWPDHVLFSRDSGRLAGVIDFGDISIGDPDYDLAFLASTLGPGFITSLLRHLPHNNPTRLEKKLQSFVLLNAIDDVFTGLSRGDRPLVDSALVYLRDQSRSNLRIGEW